MSAFWVIQKFHQDSEARLDRILILVSPTRVKVPSSGPSFLSLREISARGTMPEISAFLSLSIYHEISRCAPEGLDLTHHL